VDPSAATAKQECQQSVIRIDCISISQWTLIAAANSETVAAKTAAAKRQHRNNNNSNKNDDNERFGSAAFLWSSLPSHSYILD